MPSTVLSVSQCSQYECQSGWQLFVTCFAGHNTDGQYFVTNSKLGFAAETRPRRVMVFIEKSRDGQVTPITDVEAQDVACGQNHVVS